MQQLDSNLGSHIERQKAISAIMASLTPRSPAGWPLPILQNNLYFHHIHGTGGTTLARVLAKSTPSLRMVHVARGAPGIVVGDPSILQNSGEGCMFYGHNLFGLVEKASIMNLYMTMLRNPYDRLITDFFWGYLHEPFTTTFSARDAMKHFTEFVEKHEHLEFYIHQCSHLDFNTRARFDPEESSRMSNAEADALARTNLSSRFWYVGITELFEESIFVAALALGMSSVNSWWTMRHPHTPFRPAFMDLPKRLRNMIEDKTAYDFALYEDYRAQLERRFAEEGDGLVFTEYYNLAHPCQP